MAAALSKRKKKLQRAKAAPPAKVKPSLLPTLPAGTSFALPPAILKSLRQVMAKQQRVSFTECLVLLVAALPALWLVQGLADWWFNLPWGVRFVLLLADLGVVGFILFRFGWLPWTRRLTLETAALRVEKEIPDFRTSLISSVELASGKPGSTQGSLDLIGELLQRVSRKVQTMNLPKLVVKTGRLTRFMRYALGAVLLAVAVGYLAWPKSPILFQRILLSSVPLPTRTIVIPISKNESVPIGSDLTLSARAGGEQPKSGRLLIVYADNSRQEISASPSVDAPDVYSVTLRNVQQPFQYHFVLNDGTGSDYEVKAKVPPVLASFTCVQTYPAYTGLPEANMPAGNLAFMAGSKIRLGGRSTQPLKSAYIKLEGVTQQVGVDVGGADPVGMQAEFIVPKGMSGFSIPLVNTEGLASVENTVYRIELIEDKAPVVDLSIPSGNRLGVLTSSKPTLVYSVKDDFGIKKVTLKYKVSRPVDPDSHQGPEELGEVALPLPPAGGPAAQSYVWDLAAQKPPWTEGCTVTYWVEATDNNDVTGPGIGQSAKKTLAILSADAKRAELLEMMGARAAEIETIYNSQKKVNEDLDTTIRINKP